VGRPKAGKPEGVPGRFPSPDLVFEPGDRVVVMESPDALGRLQG